MPFNGNIGAKVLVKNTWTKVNQTSPATNDIFTATAHMLYSPGFLTRPLDEMPAVVYETTADGIKVPVSGDTQALLYYAVIPYGIDVNVKTDIQPYLRTARYVLQAGVVRQETGILIPGGWDVYAWTDKNDLSMQLYGVEGRASRFNRTAP